MASAGSSSSSSDNAAEDFQSPLVNGIAGGGVATYAGAAVRFFMSPRAWAFTTVPLNSVINLCTRPCGCGIWPSRSRCSVSGECADGLTSSRSSLYRSCFWPSSTPFGLEQRSEAAIRCRGAADRVAHRLWLGVVGGIAAMGKHRAYGVAPRLP